MLFRFLTRNSKYEYENNISINYPATDTSYHPYSNICPISGFSAVGLSVNGVVTSIQLGDTVYGGSLNVTTGVLTIDKALVTYDGIDEQWVISTLYNGFYINNPNMKRGNRQTGSCNWLQVANSTTYTSNSCWLGVNNSLIYLLDVYATVGNTVAALKSYLSEHPLQVVYPLAEPFEVQLTPTEVRTLLGNNNIFADTGDVEVEYRADIGLYIAKKTA